MLSYIIRRLFQAILVLFGVTIITFIISHVIPGDPARAAAGMNADYETVQRIRENWGLNQPLPKQYLTYIGNALKGNLGRSIMTGSPVLEDIKRRLPASIELAGVSTLLWLPLGLILGVLCAIKARGVIDVLLRLFVIAGVSMPVFWLALLFQLVFSKELGWFPEVGRISIQMTPPAHITGFYLIDSVLTANWDAFISSLKHIVLPAWAAGLPSLAIVTRMTRSSFLEVFREDYITTARAKGVIERMVLFKHALRNALIPVVTVTGIELGKLIVWMFLVELIFAWPGIGRYGVKAILNQDFMPVMGLTLVTVSVFVMINLIVDVSYTFINPQIRVE